MPGSSPSPPLPRESGPPSEEPSADAGIHLPSPKPSPLSAPRPGPGHPPDGRRPPAPPHPAQGRCRSTCRLLEMLAIAERGERKLQERAWARGCRRWSSAPLRSAPFPSPSPSEPTPRPPPAASAAQTPTDSLPLPGTAPRASLYVTPCASPDVTPRASPRLAPPRASPRPAPPGNHARPQEGALRMRAVFTAGPNRRMLAWFYIASLKCSKVTAGVWGNIIFFPCHG